MKRRFAVFLLGFLGMSMLLEVDAACAKGTGNEPAFTFEIQLEDNETLNLCAFGKEMSFELGEVEFISKRKTTPI